MSGGKDFLSRWSARKADSRDPEPVAPEPVASEPDPPEEQPSDFTAEELETLSDAELCERLNLPDPQTLEQGDDFKLFLESRVPERLRRVALRRLWRSNPIFNHIDGLDDYNEDYRAAAESNRVVQTMYKVGRGFVKPDDPEPESVDTEVTPDAPPDQFIEENAVHRKGCGETCDSSQMANAAEGRNDDAPTRDSASPGPEPRRNPERQIKSRRMSFHFVEKSNISE